MMFDGWPPTAIEFFEGLEADNSKTYWLAHKDVYERDVKSPMEALLADLTEEFGEARLFRPYRDIRFSADKSPYKTSIAATVGSMYVSLSAERLAAGGGMYHMAPDQLERYREAVVGAPGRRLQEIVNRLRATDAEVYGSDALKSAPRGYPKDHERVELLRYRGIVAMGSWPAGRWLSTPEAERRVVQTFRSAQPLLEWLNEHVGPSSEPANASRHR